MLFPYQYVPHKMEKMQNFINFIFYQVWCRAPKCGAFNLDLFDANPGLKEVMTAFFYSDTRGGDFFYGSVERIYDLFAQLTRPKIAQLKRWYQANNDIKGVCANDPALLIARYADVLAAHPELGKELAAFFKGLYSSELLGLKALKEKIGDINDHYKKFMRVNTVGKCPFCGITDIHGIYHTKREAYDHYLPKALYPFNSINFHNLVPTCHYCNSSYKISKDTAFTPNDPAGGMHRRKVFYPYANPGHKIEIEIRLKKSDIDHLEPDDLDIEFGPETLNEEIETWKDIYGIEERYKAKCCGKSDGKYWVAQVLDEWHEDGRTPADYLATLTRQTDKYPFADSNFLKTAFLEGCMRLGLFNVVAEEA